MEAGGSSLLESFDDMNLEEKKTDTITLIPHGEEEEFIVDPETKPFKAIKEADYKWTMKITSSSSFYLKISDFKIKDEDYGHEITNIQVLRYTNRLIIYITDERDKPATCLQGNKINHEANYYGEEETPEYNVSVLMGDRTQSTHYEILGMVVIRIIDL